MLLLEIKNIKKSFGNFHALKGINLDIQQGEIVSLLGANGAGKTTLSTIVATLHPPTQGDILFKGNSVYKNLVQYRQRIGYCPQKPNLNNLLTLEQNLIFAGRYYSMNDSVIKARISTLTKQFGLQRYLSQRPDTLSGGYKQRFLLARSLMHTPELILLDEPTVALDPHVRHQLWDLIKSMKQEGISILLTTHYLDEAEVLSDRVCVLDKGTVKLVDTPTNLMSSFKKGRLEEVFIHLMNETPE